MLITTTYGPSILHFNKNLCEFNGKDTHFNYITEYNLFSSELYRNMYKYAIFLSTDFLLSLCGKSVLLVMSEAYNGLKGIGQKVF